MPPKPPPSPLLRRRTILVVLLFCEVALVIALRDPVRTSLMRWTICALVAGTVVLVLALVWRFPRVRNFLLWTVGVVLVWTLVTIGYGTGIHVPTFTHALRGRLDVPYVPEGETSLGLDESGLVRVALVETHLRRFRPGAAFRLWWDDVSPAGLGNAYDDFFKHNGRFQGGVADLDPATLNPGSVAVTDSGDHMLAYVGNGEWIHTSADHRRVVIQLATDPDAWLARRIDLYVPRKTEH